MDLWQRQGQDGQVQLDVEARAVFTMAENQALVETIQQALLSSLETPASDKFAAAATTVEAQLTEAKAARRK